VGASVVRKSAKLERVIVNYLLGVQRKPARRVKLVGAD
jgi:hypothetical protein